MKILILNGPNINMLGIREPGVYGTQTFKDLLHLLQDTADTLGVEIEQYQSNHEGDLIDWMQEFGGNIAKAVYDSEGVMGIVLNAGGYTHTSVALRDAVACSQVPVVEVHVSNITEREEFRRISLLTDVCQHTIMGQGTEGYKQAIAWILIKINKSK